MFSNRKKQKGWFSKLCPWIGAIAGATIAAVLCGKESVHAMEFGAMTGLVVGGIVGAVTR